MADLVGKKIIKATNLECRTSGLFVNRDKLFEPRSLSPFGTWFAIGLARGAIARDSQPTTDPTCRLKLPPKAACRWGAKTSRFIYKSLEPSSVFYLANNLSIPPPATFTPLVFWLLRQPDTIRHLQTQNCASFFD